MLVNFFVVLITLSRLDRKKLHALSIQQHFQFMSFVQPFYFFIAVPRKPDLNFIFTVAWKCVSEQSAASCSGGQTFHLFFLSEIGPDAESLAAGRAARSSNGQLADFL